MNPEILISLGIFSVVTSVTPGPDNLMLLASGVNFGLARTLPHSLGISFGFFLLLLAVGAGIGGLLTAWPTLHVALTGISAVCLFYLAYRLALSRSIGNEEARSRPLTFTEAAFFQWVNPKAWVMALSGMALYTDKASPFLSMLVVAALFSLLNWPCVALWATFGTMLRRLLAHAARLRWFNLLMAALMAMSVIPIVIG
ncbi:LysE family translocator [Chelatococcus sp. SYSU_G07232]|uniref:LysE family translocator n=1 Tax=Chelatococcus albus TaxID=3047466 RepID=A0ABT7ACW9_9HYPH|nr:LysE family translocator [Chelatococcus sp. SYSU_G07232]MDJ1156669.1 LysE family translocator [Chelatococcus sp. SYSU_G07232]